MASWKAAFLFDWKWEAYDKVTEEDTVYFGRVKSPNTYGNWEYGYFSQEQLEKAGAYRTDIDLDDGEPVLDSGPEEHARLFETELDALRYRDPEEEDENNG